MIVAADLEGTLTTGETWKGIGLPGALLVKAYLLPKPWYRERWMVDLARLFKGWDEAALRRMAEWVVEHELWARRRPSVIAELEAHRRAGATLILASATYQPVIEIFAERCGAVQPDAGLRALAARRGWRVLLT